MKPKGKQEYRKFIYKIKKSEICKRMAEDRVGVGGKVKKWLDGEEPECWCIHAVAGLKVLHISVAGGAKKVADEKKNKNEEEEIT